jgi:hypothetical protein
MDPQLTFALQEISKTLLVIAQNQQQTFVTTIGASLGIFLTICFVFWRLAKRLDARHDETRQALADLHATSQAIVAQTAELLRRTA